MIWYRTTRTRKPPAPRLVLQILVLGVLAVIASSGILYHCFDIDIMACFPGVPICPFRAATRIPCPGCGMTRALLSLGQLKIAEAMHHNPFSVPLFLGMILCLYPGKAPSWLDHRWTGISMVILVLGVWFWRLKGAL